MICVSEHQSWSLYPLWVEPPRPTLRSLRSGVNCPVACCPRGHKNSPTSSSHCGLQEVVSASYPVVDSSLRMIRCSSCLWRYARQSRPFCAPRMITISCRLRSVQALRGRVRQSVLASPPGSGAEGTRTPDIRLAKAALSQLSYGPGPAVAARWANLDSNQGPQSYQDCALAS